jgi:NADH:ubiquinone oxidoreductase subunit D
VPEGEYYCASECANGELGFTIVSDGSGHPYRIKVRSPSFAHVSAFNELVEGLTLADSMATLPGLNMIAGELDR